MKTQKEHAKELQSLTDEYETVELQTEKILREIHSSPDHIATPELLEQLEALVKKGETLHKTIETLNEQLDEEHQIDYFTLIEVQAANELHRGILEEIRDARSRGKSLNNEIER